MYYITLNIFTGVKSHRRRSTVRRQSTDSRSDTAIWLKSRSKSPPSLSKCTLFIKMPDSNAYLPITLRKRSIRHLLEAIQLKCPSFQPYSVINIYQRRPDGKMLFHLDDDMMAYMENKQIFDIELQARPDDSEKWDMTLSEVMG